MMAKCDSSTPAEYFYVCRGVKGIQYNVNIMLSSTFKIIDTTLVSTHAFINKKNQGEMRSRLAPRVEQGQLNSEVLF